MSWSIPQHPGGFLTGEERASLASVFDAIFPGDPARGVPTTSDAGVVEFLDRLLSCDAAVYREIPAWRTLYREGIAALASAALSRYGADLHLLPRHQVADLLKDLERGALDMGPTPQRALFRVLRMHCIQGCFADPDWGGNADRVMWRWLGYGAAPEDIHGNEQA